MIEMDAHSFLDARVHFLYATDKALADDLSSSGGASTQ